MYLLYVANGFHLLSPVNNNGYHLLSTVESKMLFVIRRGAILIMAEFSAKQQHFRGLLWVFHSFMNPACDIIRLRQLYCCIRADAVDDTPIINEYRVLIALY